MSENTGNDAGYVLGFLCVGALLLSKGFFHWLAKWGFNIVMSIVENVKQGNVETILVLFIITCLALLLLLQKCGIIKR